MRLHFEGSRPNSVQKSAALHIRISPLLALLDVSTLSASRCAEPCPKLVFNLVLGESLFEFLATPGVGDLLDVSQDRILGV